MASYDWAFNGLGLQDWCTGGVDASEKIMTMAELLGQAQGKEIEVPWYQFPFPSLDALNASCPTLSRTRDMTSGVEDGFLGIKDGLKFVLDPLTQPLSWMLDGSLYLFLTIPWFILMPLIALATYYVSRSIGISILVAISFLFLGFIDHYVYAIETLSIIMVCTVLSVLFGVPIGVAMSKSNKTQRAIIPVLDMLQTLPSFVYLIPLIFLFSVTESKLYGIAIILYAIVPIVRLTDLGIRLVDQDVVEAADAYGMTPKQKLTIVEIPLALPNIMAGLNQTIMMSLAMVVIASLVSAPGLGVLVLRGIRNLELGVGLVSGFCIVLLAVLLDRVSKAALQRVDASTHNQ